MLCGKMLNPLPNDKILDQSKFKVFADKYKCDLKIEISFGKRRKHCEKQAFSPLPTMFSKGLAQSVLKGQDCVVKS